MNKQKEALFLENYDITKYDRPSIAADVAIFTVMEDRNDNYRKLPVKKLKIMLIKRGVPPYEGCWALPGGFLRKGETIENAAYRELMEETGVKQPYLQQIGVFSNPGRDPRGWIISDAFMALTDATNLSVSGQDDASDARWFQVSITMLSSNKKREQGSVIEEKQFELLLSSEKDVLKAVLEEKIIIDTYHCQSELKVIESSSLAFDHGIIILTALRKLREQTEDGNIAFDLLPEFFTLTDLQLVYETILDKEMLKANFRRKIAGKVLPTEQVVEGAGHRPAQLFERNLNAFSCN